MKCQFCENEVPPNVSNCPSCGAAVPQQFVQQQPYQPGMRPGVQPGYQPEMQSRVQPGMPYGASPESAKSRTIYIVLGLLLGVLGIHNFYAGRTGYGIIQLLVTLGIGWLGVPLFLVEIWVIIELFTVNKDGRGVPFY